MHYIFYYTITLNLSLSMQNLYKKDGKPSRSLDIPTLQKNLPAKPTGFICTLIEGSLFFGATLPQQLLHLSKLIRGNVLPLQQCGKEAHDLRFVGMGINRGSKILFSC